ncbi:hypothetical protein DPMN_064610 [Dreissena polymorpha]|uniref:Uncharacterized protein n=1 Tax=Dreissena polymorpha TaxID=45954 RepID=A0A9D4CDW3_DREPO|nr:hypothetical protein DPMN_064610 [Dreissena polymorpha]
MKKYFKLDQGIIGTNLLTKFHEDRPRNVPSRVFTRKTAPPTGLHVFQWTETTLNSTNISFIKTTIFTNFELDQEFIGTKLLTMFHEDQTRNVASRVFMNKYDRQRPITNAHLSNKDWFDEYSGIKLDSNFWEKSLLPQLWRGRSEAVLGRSGSFAITNEPL